MMLINSVNRMLLIAFTALSLLGLACSLLSWHAHQTLEAVNAQRAELSHLVHRVDSGVEALSTTARAYAATGHPRYRQDYADEQRDGRRSERALAALRAMALEPDDLKALDHVYDGVEHVRALTDQVIEVAETAAQEGKTNAPGLIFRPQPAALAIAYGEGMDGARHQASLALRTFRQRIEDRMAQAVGQTDRLEVFAETALTLVWIIGTLALSLAVFFYYRRMVLEPIETLTEELAQTETSLSRPLSNQTLNNEVGRMIRVASRAKESVAQMEFLRRIKTATAEITLAAHQASSLPGIAQTLSVHLSQRLNHAVVVVHLRPSRKAPLELYGGRLRTGQDHSVLASMVRDRVQGTRTQPTDPGLVIECERSQKVLQVTGLPPAYLWLNAGTGKSRPRCLTLAPIVFDRRTLGVVEIASLSPLESPCLTLVKETCDSMALLLDRAIPHGYPPGKPSEPPVEPVHEDLL